MFTYSTVHTFLLFAGIWLHVGVYVPVSRRDAEAEHVADLGVDGVPGRRGAGDHRLDAAADEPGDLRGAAISAAGCCLRDLSVDTCVSGSSSPLINNQIRSREEVLIRRGGPPTPGPGKRRHETKRDERKPDEAYGGARRRTGGRLARPIDRARPAAALRNAPGSAAAARPPRKYWRL